MSPNTTPRTPFYPNRKADVVKINESRCTIETSVVHSTLFDNVWGYSVGHLKVWDDGHAKLYCCGRDDVRFNLVGLPDEQLTFPSETQAMEFFHREYTAALKAADEYGERVLNVVREAGLPELTFERKTDDGESITCIMQVGFPDEYIGKCVYVECSPQEALALLNHQGIYADCKGSRHADFQWEHSGRGTGHLSWFSNGDTLSIGVGAYARDNRIASCKLAEWRRQ